MGFDPVTMAAIGIGGAVISASGQIAGGVAAQNRANYQAQVARNNAQLAKQNAAWAEAQGYAEESAQGMKGRAGIGKLKAGMAAGGIDVGSGSAADVLDSAAALNELDTLTIRSNAARKVYGYNVEAESQEEGAKLSKYEGDSAMEGAEIGALGSLLSSASSVGGKYAAWQNTAGTPTPHPRVVPTPW